MPKKRNGANYQRREFLKRVAAGGALATTGADLTAVQPKGKQRSSSRNGQIKYPRVFTGRNLNMIAFPLGGIGTGTISLGGRGQFRDWEIFNRPDKGNSPEYGFASIWAQASGRKPVARVLESRIEPPYEGESGLGAKNVPGLPRLAGATFTGGYPFARIDFHDDQLPVRVWLEAFNPLVPLDVPASGLPIAVLRYHFRNPSSAPAKVGVAISIQNPVGEQGRQSVFRSEEGVAGLYMSNPMLPAADPLKGSFFFGVLGAPEHTVTYLRGWKRAQWWDGALTFWDDFSADGALDSNSPAISPVGSVAVTQSVPAESERETTFLLAWHFPNRTPERCGWEPVEGEAKTVVGNAYCQRFADSWAVAKHIGRELASLEKRSREFVEAVKSSTLPGAALDAALSNLSTLRTNTAFLTADGEFHAFEGCGDHAGCCHGSCTHVWNYEQATAFVFPSLARSLRESEFLRNTKENGLMGFRSYLPDGKQIWNQAAADGQMGCLMKLYRDWQLSGDTDWLRKLWPHAKRALEFAWIENGWDANRDGVEEGVQHNTYDVEFYGPNPLCGVWYLGALRAGEEIARALGDEGTAQEYRRVYENGRKWIDANLFNGEYYIQKVMGHTAAEVAPGLRVGMGSADPLKPDYQMGEACLADQLLGQYMAHVAGLGYLLDEGHVRKTLESIYRYNYVSNLGGHANVQRTYALNDEGGVLIASYAAGKRPEIPFPYYAEVWTGLEYQFAASLIYENMLEKALTVVETARRRHDGERRNPWNEPECGHHYARAMSSWALLIALNGFHYSGVDRKLSLVPRVKAETFRSFWIVPSGWGAFAQVSGAADRRFEVHTREGMLAVRSLALGQDPGPVARIEARLGGEKLAATQRGAKETLVIAFERELRLVPGQPLVITAWRK